MATPENRWTELRNQLYAMPLEELRRLAYSYFDISVSETGVWSILPPAKGTISPEAEFTISTWADRGLAAIREENAKERAKELLGLPNDFDPYAPF